MLTCPCSPLGLAQSCLIQHDLKAVHHKVAEDGAVESVMSGKDVLRCALHMAPHPKVGVGLNHMRVRCSGMGGLSREALLSDNDLTSLHDS